MAAGELQALTTPDRRTIGRRALALSLIAFVGAMVGVGASPVILETIYAKDRDFSVAGNVGQAYGGASALVAMCTLFVVVLSVAMQHIQRRDERAQSLAEFNEELVSLAMENPKYRQCWGARIAPDGIDEDLFYYCSKVVRLWTSAWELGNIDERQVREYLQNFFDSEIPRLYWKAHGDWHRRGHLRNRRETFRELVNEEYLRAVKAGPPTRNREAPPPSADHFIQIDRNRVPSMTQAETIPDPRGRRRPIR